MTVHSVQVVEDKATELNFTLAPVVSEAAGSSTVPTSSVPSSRHPNISTTATDASNSTVAVSSGDGNNPSMLPPENIPVQPQEFRHHNYADMELFLRKYSSEFPSIVHLYSIGRSVEDRELYVMVISDNPTVHEHGMCYTRATQDMWAACVLRKMS